MKVLGIDASLRGTGLAVIDQQGTRTASRHWEVVKLGAQAPHSECLGTIRERIDAVLAAHKPDAAAIEGGFFFKNAKVAMVLGEVRGVAIACCAAAGVPVYEYSPRRAKQNITGWGAAAGADWAEAAGAAAAGAAGGGGALGRRRPPAGARPTSMTSGAPKYSSPSSSIRRR